MAADRSDVFERINNRMPRDGDQLFRTVRDPFALLAQQPAERMYRLNLGYKLAGDVLVERALRDRVERRNLLFPIIFSYRHYVELAIKALLDEHAATVGYKPDLSKHELTRLWEQLRKMLELGGGFHQLHLTAMSSIIAESASIDPGSFSFRYPTSLKGEAFDLPPDGVDLLNFHDVMNGVENWFQCADLALTHEDLPHS